jgi:hypothetical protein
MLLTGFSGTFIGDLILDSRGLVPDWYIRLRLPLTLGTLACLGVTFVQML